jgi:hypothetical protein
MICLSLTGSCASSRLINVCGGSVLLLNGLYDWCYSPSLDLELDCKDLDLDYNVPSIEPCLEGKSLERQTVIPSRDLKLYVFILDDDDELTFSLFTTTRV